jgi:hypothetical protein
MQTANTTIDFRPEIQRNIKWPPIILNNESIKYSLLSALVFEPRVLCHILLGLSYRGYAARGIVMESDPSISVGYWCIDMSDE